MKFDDPSPSTRSIEELYRAIQKLPQNQWPKLIARLPAEKKKLLLQHIDNGRLITTSKTTATANTSEATKADNTNEIFDVKYVKTKTETSNIEYQKTTVEDASTDVSLIHVLEDFPLLHIINHLLFAAGDSHHHHNESSSIVHRYLNMWMSAIWCSFCRYHALHKTKNLKTSMHRYIKLRFPSEHRKYMETHAILKIARKMTPSANDVTKQNNFDDDTAARIDDCIKHSPLFNDLLPSTRFDYRLEYRDVRTTSMSQSDYTIFTTARSNSFKTKRYQFISWLSAITSINTQYTQRFIGRPDLTFPSSTIAFWIFAANDRINLIVETARRIQLTGEHLITYNALQQGDVQLTSFQEVVDALRGDLKPLKLMSSIDPTIYKCAVDLLLMAVDSVAFKLKGVYSLSSLNTFEGPKVVSVDCNNTTNADTTVLIGNANSTAFGDIYETLGMMMNTEVMERNGIEGLWSEVVQQSETNHSICGGVSIPHITDFMLFVTLRLKHILWKNRKQADASTVFPALLKEWKMLKTSEAIQDEETPLKLQDVQQLTHQLHQYLQIADKITKVMSMLSAKFPQFFNLKDDGSSKNIRSKRNTLNLSLHRKWRCDSLSYKRKIRNY